MSAPQEQRKSRKRSQSVLEAVDSGFLQSSIPAKSFISPSIAKINPKKVKVGKDSESDGYGSMDDEPCDDNNSLSEDYLMDDEGCNESMDITTNSDEMQLENQEDAMDVDDSE